MRIFIELLIRLTRRNLADIELKFFRLLNRLKPKFYTEPAEIVRKETFQICRYKLF